MKSKDFLLIVVFILIIISCIFPLKKNVASSKINKIPEPITIKLEKITSDVNAPVAMATSNDGSGRLFIVEQTGKIKIIKNGKILNQPFLDVKGKLDNLNRIYTEKGLLGLAFHPNYKKNGRFFIYYSAKSNKKGSDHKGIIAEYKVSASNPDQASEQERIIMEVEQPESNHNGGTLMFGSDKYLYIGLGDGGGAGDKHGSIGNAQDLNTVLGKMLRINVDGKQPYEIPATNPFIKSSHPEIWAYGLRNPWKFSFDKVTGRLFCGDVGQNRIEEIDIIEKGKNYGWKIMEGSQCFESEDCKQTGLTKPIAEYGRGKGISVTGGYVYRGKSLRSLYGKYVFADWNGKMYFLEEVKPNSWKTTELYIEGKSKNDAGFRINSFGEDENGELYVLAQSTPGLVLAGGLVYKINVKM